MWVGGRVTALAAWASDPRALTSRGPWGRRCRGTHDPTRSRERSWGRRSVHKLTKSASRRRFGALVYTVATLVATRAASGGTSVPTTMTYRRHSLGGHLPLGRKNRLCTSGAAARLASSPRQQPTQTPEEPQKAMGPSLFAGNNASSRLLGRQEIKGIIDAHYQTASHPWSQGVQAATCP